MSRIDEPRNDLTTGSTPTDLRPPRGEWAALLLLLGAFLAFNLATCNYYPTVWCDEVWFAEPAVNAVRFGSFTTLIWQFQPFNSFPVVNCPLYPMALVPWLAATGTNLLAVRSLNYALMTSAGFLFWLSSWRLGLVRSSLLRLVMVAVLYLGYGMSYSYRCSRPDILGMNCLLLLLLAFQIRRPRLRKACLAALAAVTVWIGLQVALFAWFAAAVAVVFLRRLGLREMVVLSVGMVLGGGALALFLAWKGVLAYFLSSTFLIVGKHYAHEPHISAGVVILRIIRYSLRNYVEDFSTVAITLGLAAMLVAVWKQLSLATRRLVLWCLVVVFAVPPVFNVIGHFAFYYAYMRFAPAMLAFFSVYSDLVTPSNRPRPLLRLVFGTTLALATIVGLPLRLALSPLMYRLAPRSEIKRIIKARISATDVVFTQQAAFFEAKEITQAVYDIFSSPSFLYFPVPGRREFSAERRQAVSVLVIRPEQIQQVTNFFGGIWTPVSGPFGDTPNYQRLARLPIIGGRLVHYAEQPQNLRCPLQVFRRLSASAETPPGGAPR